jgi:limonene 1,2-monooxygenase
LAQVNGTAAGSGAGAAVIGTPDELVKMIRDLHQLTGGFGVVIGFAHDWAKPE